MDPVIRRLLAIFATQITNHSHRTTTYRICWSWGTDHRKMILITERTQIAAIALLLPVLGKEKLIWIFLTQFDVIPIPPNIPNRSPHPTCLARIFCWITKKCLAKIYRMWSLIIVFCALMDRVIRSIDDNKRREGLKRLKSACVVA